MSVKPDCASPGPAQHDDSAEMVVDGVSLYREEAADRGLAGFKQFCTPAALSPGWHDLELTYGSSPLDAYSVLRFFVVDAAAVAAVDVSKQTTYEITWKVRLDLHPPHNLSLPACKTVLGAALPHW